MKAPAPVLEEAISEIIVFKTLQSSPEDIISSIACTPEFAKSVVSILIELIERIENSSEGKIVH